MGILAFDYEEIAGQSLERLCYAIKNGMCSLHVGNTRSSTCDFLKLLVSLVSAEMKKIVPPQPAPLGREEGEVTWGAVLVRFVFGVLIHLIVCITNLAAGCILYPARVLRQLRRGVGPIGGLP